MTTAGTTRFSTAPQNAALGAGNLNNRKQNVPDKDLSAIPAYGMPMWFEVAVHLPGGTVTLGKWSGCQNLKVDFGHEDVISNGVHDAPYIAPTHIKYGEVTLERAMEASDSKAVREWLVHVAKNWINGEEGAAGLLESPSSTSDAYQGDKVDITLFSALTSTDPTNPRAHVVAEWHLRDVIPLSWSGPSLSSKSNDIALEKLVLFHRGFLGDIEPAAGAASGPAPGPANSTLTLTRADAKQAEISQNSIVFQYNPKTITYEVIQPNKDKGTKQFNMSSTGEFAHVEGQLSVKIGALRVEGAKAVHNAWEKLRLWTGVDQSASERNEIRVRATLGTKPGLVLDEEIVLKQVSFTCSRYTSSGVACRAEITLTLVKPHASEAGESAGATAPKSAPAGGGGGKKPKQGKGSAAGKKSAEPPNRDGTLGEDPNRPRESPATESPVLDVASGLLQIP